MPWNPDIYHKFQAQRAAPFEDAVKLVKVRPGLHAVDLGCGTGELTRRLADMLPDSDVVGMDNSPQMLEKAAEVARPGLRFELGSIEDFGGEWDLIFSHAALHWVEDHPSLMPRLLSHVKPGGQMVVQMPSNFTHYSHVAIRQLASEAPFVTALNGWNRVPPVLSIDAYAEIFFKAGGEDITVFEKVYPHVLENADAVADWVSGTALVPYFERLGDLRDAFMEAYRARLRAEWPESPVFYGFRRTLFSVTRC